MSAKRVGFFEAREGIAFEASGAVHSEPGRRLHVDARLFEGGHFGHLRIALAAGDGNDAHFASTVHFSGFGHHVKLVANVAAQQRRVGWCTALEGDVVQADARRLLQQHPHEVRQGACTGCAVTGRSRVVFGFGHHVGHGFCVAGGARDHAKLEAGDLRDGCEVFHRVVVELFVDVGKQHHGAAGQHNHGLAIGLGGFDQVQGNASASARFVVHHDGAKVIAQRIGHHAGQHVGRAARWKADQDFQRWSFLRLQAGRERRQTQGQQSQTAAAEGANVLAEKGRNGFHDCLRGCWASNALGFKTLCK
jgi:hypothetical protein